MTFQPEGFQPDGYQPDGWQPEYDQDAANYMPRKFLSVALDTCSVVRECKRAADVERRGWDLTWFCARAWAPWTYFPTGIRIRPRPIELGGQSGFVGFEYEATTGGYTGEDEPAWPITGTVGDGTVVWTARAISDASLHRTIASVGSIDWSADIPLTVSNITLITNGGIVQIAADHAGGTARRTAFSRAEVTFSDGTVGEFAHKWKITG